MTRSLAVGTGEAPPAARETWMKCTGKFQRRGAPGQPAHWIHPDRLDRVAAAGADPGTPALATPVDLATILERAVAHGGLRRMPRNPRHRDVVLAVLCLAMQRRHAYPERELNDYLKSRLRLMGAEIDHVTCRRYLVDCGFLRRDRAGARYLLNFPQVEATLSVEALESAERTLLALADRPVRGDPQR
jgi:hypothetical protein